MTIISKLRAVLTLGRGVLRGLSYFGPDDDPIKMFEKWFREARESGLVLPEAMTLATATADARPSARMMLLKAVDQNGFVFYTNYDSRKAVELDENRKAALVFHWPLLERQVRIEGTVDRISKEESEAYFATRSRGSQIGAWASAQSAVMESRAELERRVREHRTRFQGGGVPLPPFWGGYRVRPECIEFWQGRLDRLHDRLRYERNGSAWQVTRLYP